MLRYFDLLRLIEIYANISSTCRSSWCRFFHSPVFFPLAGTAAGCRVCVIYLVELKPLRMLSEIF